MIIKVYISFHVHKKESLVASLFNPSTWETEVEGSGVQSHPQLCGDF